MKPIGKNIIVKTIEEDVVTDSGLILSGDDANQLRYKKGLVVAPGTDVSVISEGDVIYYDKAHGYTMIIRDTQYTIIQERDVVVVLS
jgi:co-chaperonin GroES (HSP10)